MMSKIISFKIYKYPNFPRQEGAISLGNAVQANALPPQEGADL